MRELMMKDVSVLYSEDFFFAAQEMIRHDKVVELLQQRQEKDLKQLNKVSVCVCVFTIANMFQAGIKLLPYHPAVSNRIS